MPELMTNIPLVRCFVRPDFIGAHCMTECDLIAAKSEPGSPLMFHALLRTGATYFNLPIHAFALHENARPVRYDDEPTQQQLWDCQTCYFACLVISRLDDQECEVQRLDGESVTGNYLMTFDWRSPPNEIDTSVVNLPDERKSAHLIAGTDGCLYAMPNNRIRWVEPGFINKPTYDPLRYKPITRTWRCERKFVTKHEDTVNYTAEPVEPAKPVEPAAKPMMAWRDATPDDVGKGLKCRVRDSETSPWKECKSDGSERTLMGYRSLVNLPWRTDNDTVWRFAQVYAPCGEADDANRLRS